MSYTKIITKDRTAEMGLYLTTIIHECVLRIVFVVMLVACGDVAQLDIVRRTNKRITFSTRGRGHR